MQRALCLANARRLQQRSTETGARSYFPLRPASRCTRLHAERRSNRQDCAANVVRVDKPDEATTLFVYGSLTDPVRREEVIGRRIDIMPATLHDYELGRARYFYIRPHPGISTAGFLLLNLMP